MDVYVRNNRAPHYRLNNYQNRHPEDDMQFLSLEERECILFFEETIGSLEEELDNEGAGTPAHSRTPSQVRPASYAAPSLRDHDIIDLVHPTPDAQKHTDIMPDFQRLMVAPESHFEIKANRAAPVNSPPRVTISAPEEGSNQPPPGSVPTPVIIASKIAEHQGASGSSSSPSSLLQRRRSLEFPQNPLTKHGPPTHAKPAHLPDNISVLLGSREHIPHSIAAEAVSVQERRAQMLANLSGSAHPLDGGEPSCVRNLPIRSVSFRQPTPDQSREEALSKLGLAQRRAQSVMQPSARDPNKDSSVVRTAFKSNSTPPHTSSTSSRVHEPSTAHVHTANNHNIASTTKVVAKVQGTDTTDHCQSSSTADKQDQSGHSAALTSAEITHTDFNSYGGKSISLNPTTSFKSEQVPFHKAENPEVQLNSFGGWSRVMTPSVAHRDEPNHGSGGYSQSPPSTTHISQPHGYGARSKSFSQGKEVTSLHPGSRTTIENVPTREVISSQSKAPSQPAVTRPSAQTPSPAPRPQHHSSPLSPTRPKPSPSSPELRRAKPAPKPSFRTQGVTVQFSGKGATDEARRDALRRLGLLRGNP